MIQRKTTCQADQDLIKVEVEEEEIIPLIIIVAEAPMEEDSEDTGITITTTVRIGTTVKKIKKFLIGNKGQESFKKVQEDLITESNIKYGAEMAYIVLHLKEKPYDNIVLKAPTTTLAIIEDAKAKDLSAEAGTTSTHEDEARAQRQAEIEANKVCWNFTKSLLPHAQTNGQ